MAIDQRSRRDSLEFEEMDDVWTALRRDFEFRWLYGKITDPSGS